MKRLIFILLFCLSAASTTAQGSDEDRGFITNFLQDNLSGAGRIVRIDGFAGALSSRARLDRLTIADEIGVWFIIENVVLDWNRLALFSGRLDVNTLSAGSIELLRLPETTESATAPEASVFQLPELPVSIRIAALKADRIKLAEPVLGENITATLIGEMQIADGAGSVDLTLNRTDDKTGKLALKGAFANETNILDIDLSLQEQSGGILANALDLPGEPSVDFQLSGNDPLSNFKATIRLGTDGAPRLSGTIEISDAPEDENIQRFIASIGGDISPLFLSEYQPFFGDNTQLFLDGSRNRNGGLNLQEFSLKTAALEFSGSLIMSADKLPEQFSITGTLHSPDNIVALLPLTGEPVKLGSAEIKAEFQADKHNRWSLEARFADLNKGGFGVSSGNLVATGIIDRMDSGERNVTADIHSDLSGLRSTDPALAKAMGTNATASTKIVWQDNAPVTFDEVVLSAGGIDIAGQAAISDSANNLRVTGTSEVSADDLGRFSDLLSLPTAGKADVKIAGWYEPLGGAFDTTITGRTTDLAFGPDPLPALLKGDGTVDITVQRDLTGVHLQKLDIKTEALKISANGDLQTGASVLKFDTSLSDIALVAENLSGPATLTGSIHKNGSPWNIEASAKGPVGTNLSLIGSIETDPGTADLKIIGQFPLELADRFLPSNISVNGNGNIDLQLIGPLALQSLQGDISTSNATVSMPTYNVSLADLNATVSLSNGNANINSTANNAQGGRLTTTGALGLTSPYATNIDVVMDQFAYVDQPSVETKLNGQINLSGELANTLSLSGNIDLLETDIYLASTNSGGRIPGISHTHEPADVRLTRQRAGFEVDHTEETASSNGAGMGLNVVIHAPGRIFLRGSGLNAEMQGDLHLTGTTNDVVPVGQFNLVRGHLDVFGRRLDLREGRLLLQGSFAPFFRVVAQTKTDNAIVRVAVEGNPDSPDISFSSEPYLPEDEVLAELLFGKSLSEMTPVEAVTLAAQVASLRGGGGNRISEHFREDLGLDAFGVTTSEDGNLALQAGKYISDNIYADIVIDAQGHSRIDLNMDLTTDFTIRGSTDNRGNTGIGIFYGKDY